MTRRVTDRILFVGLTIAIAIFFALSTWSLLRLSSVEEQIRYEVKESPLWGAVQLEVELMRFLLSVDLYSRGSIDRETLDLRLDVLWSRLNLYQEGDEHRHIEKLPEHAKTIADFRRSLEQAEARLANFRPGDSVVASEIIRQLATYAPKLTAFSLAVLDVARMRQLETREAHRTLRESLQLFIVGAAVSGLGLVALLVYQVSRARALLAEAQAARREAQQASLAKSQFLAMMSHEIRTPLNGVLGALDLLSERKLEAESDQLLWVARQSGETLMHILNDLLDFSKIEAGRLTLEAVPVNLGEIVTSVARATRMEASAKGIAVTVIVDERLPKRVIGDPVRLRQMLMNFTSNAVKFSDGGEITIACRVCDGGKVEISVCDQGIGIAPERHKDVFRDFVQMETWITRQYGGTGLGLAITKRLAEIMGGEVGFETEVGKGSRFWFRVPLQAAARDPALQLARESPDAILLPDGEPPRILVVEDNRTNRLIVVAMLEKLGCSVEVAASGAEAVQRASTEDFDLVLMDISMPEMDGIETTRRIRRLRSAAELPIVALTATVLESDPRTYAEAGLNGVITKPVRRSSLKHEVEAALAGRAAARGATVSAPEVPERAHG